MLPEAIGAPADDEPANIGGRNCNGIGGPVRSGNGPPPAKPTDVVLRGFDDGIGGRVDAVIEGLTSCAVGGPRVAIGEARD